MLRRFLLGLLVAGIAGSAHAGPLQGQWSGQVHQADGQRYPVTLTLGDHSASVDYPSFSCGGRLVPLGRWSRSAIYREHILRGAETPAGGDGCVDGGLVRVRLQGERLVWQWTSPDGNPSLNGRAVLTRRR